MACRNNMRWLLQKNSSDAAEKLRNEKAREKCSNTQILLTILENVLFLAREGLPQRDYD